MVHATIYFYRLSRELFIKNFFIGKKVIPCKKIDSEKHSKKTHLRLEHFIFVGEELCNILKANNQLIINY